MNWFKKIRQFLVEVREEILKCTRPSWEELKESTIIIIVTMFVLGGFIFCTDFLITKGLALILGTNV